MELLVGFFHGEILEAAGNEFEWMGRGMKSQVGRMKMIHRAQSKERLHQVRETVQPWVLGKGTQSPAWS